MLKFVGLNPKTVDMGLIVAGYNCGRSIVYFDSS